MNLDCNRAYELGEAWTRGALRLKPVDRIANPAGIARGEVAVVDPIEFVAQEGIVAHDVIGTGYPSLTIVSDQFLQVLTDHAFKGWGTFPVAIRVADRELTGYNGFAVTGRAGPIDDSLSELVLLPPPVPGGRSSRALRGLCFQSETWDGSDIFTLANSTGICAAEWVVDMLQSAGVSNLQARRLSEIDRTWRADKSPV